MTDLNDSDALHKIDPQDTLGITEKMLDQCSTAWEEVNNLTFPKIENIKNVVFCGMGASIYSAHVLKSLMGREIPFPTEVMSDYFLPDWVDHDTLVVLTSYSGTTEEILSCAQEAKDKGAHMVIFTRGGLLAEFAKDNNIPAYIFDGLLNTSNVPRFGLGYTIFGLLGLLNKLSVIDIEDQEITSSLTRMREKIDEIKQQASADHKIFINKIPIIIAAEHLCGNAQMLRNQFNETSKTFSASYFIPDLNHHLLEGLQFPPEAPLHFIMLDSPLYAEKIKKRLELTISVVTKNNYPVHEFTTSGQTVYDDFLESFLYGSLLTVYLGLHYDQNPAANKWGDWFQSELTKPQAEK